MKILGKDYPCGKEGVSGRKSAVLRRPKNLQEK